MCGFSLPTVCFVLLAGLAVSVTRGGRPRVGLGESDVVEVEPSPARPSPPSPVRPHRGSTPLAPTDPPERGLNVRSHRARCLSGDLGRGDWVACDRAAHAVAGCDPAGVGGDRAWEFSPEARERCEASKIDRDELASMLAGETVAVVGDSAARMVYAAILRLVAKDPDAWRLDTSQKHRDWTHPLAADGAVAKFAWAPFAQNVTSRVRDLFEDDGRRPPAALVMGAALWHELHVDDAGEYGAALANLAAELASPNSAGKMLGAGESRRGALAGAEGGAEEGAEGGGAGKSGTRTVAFWLTPSRTVPAKFADGRKRARMTPENGDAFARVAASSPLFERVAPTGRTFVVPVDLGAITASCGEECTEDGIHYAPASYDAAAQIIANALRAAWTE